MPKDWKRIRKQLRDKFRVRWSAYPPAMRTRTSPSLWECLSTSVSNLMLHDTLFSQKSTVHIVLELCVLWDEASVFTWLVLSTLCCWEDHAPALYMLSIYSFNVSQYMRLFCSVVVQNESSVEAGHHKSCTVH